MSQTTKVTEATGNKLVVQVTDKVRLTLRTRSYHNLKTSEYFGKTRVYASNADSAIEMEEPPYGSTRGDGSPEDAAWRKYNNLERRAMRTMIDAARPVLAALTSLPADAKASFSRHAGCNMCPCSPGFILDYARYGGQPFDVWLDATHEGRDHRWTTLHHAAPGPDTYYSCPDCSISGVKKGSELPRYTRLSGADWFARGTDGKDLIRITAA